MNTSILQHYQQLRQSGDADTLYKLADRLDLLCPLERHNGSINPSRQQSLVRRIESRLGNPEQILANNIYLLFYQTGIQAGCYKLNLGDETLTTYCQIRAKLYWAGKLTPEEWELLAEVEDTDLSLNPEFERSISQALEQCLAQFEIWEAA